MRPIAFLAAMTLAAGPASAAPGGATATAAAKATVLKPLSLTALQDLDLGTIILGNGSWTGAIVALSQAGVLNCSNANLTCVGATQVARYRVTGSNRQTVTIQAPDVVLTNGSDGTQQLILVLDKPSSISLPNSGNQGVVFAIGGRVTVTSSTPGGLYSGTFNVTVDY